MPTHKCKLYFLILLSFILPCLGLLAQEESKVIKEIEVVGLKIFSKKEILDLLQSKEGEGFSREKWDADKITLQKTGYFNEIDFTLRERSTYVRMVITVDEKKVNRNVKSIKVEGLKILNTAQILATIRTQVGQPFNHDRFNSDVLKLINLSFSSDVKSKIDQQMDGVDITIYLKEDKDWYDKLQVEVLFDGNGSLKKHLREQVLLSDDGLYLDAAHIEMVKRRIVDYYKTKSFFFIKVDTAVELKRTKKVLIFYVYKGPKLRVGDLDIIGNEVWTDKQLIKKAHLGAKPYFKYATNTKFTELAFDEDKIKITQFYHTHGFIDVKMEVLPIIYNASLDRIYLRYQLKEGPQYRINKIMFKGNQVFSPEELSTATSSVSGDPYNPHGVHEDAKSIEDMYGTVSRLFTVVQPKVLFDNNCHLVDITYEIKESEKITINKVSIRGNDITKETVFLRELELFPGDLYDQIKYDRSKRNLGRLPFIDYQKLDVSVVPSGENQGEMIINLEETQSGNLQFGAAFNEIDKFVGTVSVSERNFNWLSLLGMAPFKGGGQNLSISTAIGPSSQRYSINFSNPMIFDKLIRFSLTSYLREREFSEYDEVRLGGGMSIGKNIINDLWGSLAYRIENVEIEDVSDDAAQVIKDEEGEYLISALTLAFTFDKRNNFSFPTSGYFVKISETLAESFLIGERDFTQTHFEISGYLPLFYRIDETKKRRYPYYLAGHLEMTANFPYNDSIVPLSDKFFTGGPTSVRGFEPNRLSPRDGNEYYPGNFRVLSNLEFNMPLYEETIYLAFFVDAGYVWEDPQDFDFDDLRISAGVTLRLRLPAFSSQPISLNYGVPIKDKDGDEHEEFSFSFVTTF